MPEDGPRFENLTACHLLEWVHHQQDTEGLDLELRYFRDRDGREVDFVIERRGVPSLLVECKWSDAKRDRSLKYLKARFPKAEAWQISATGVRDYVTPQGSAWHRRWCCCRDSYGDPAGQQSLKHKAPIRIVFTHPARAAERPCAMAACCSAHAGTAPLPQRRAGGQRNASSNIGWFRVWFPVWRSCVCLPDRTPRMTGPFGSTLSAPAAQQRYIVYGRLPRRPGLEAAVNPQILLDTAFDLGFEHRVQSLGVCQIVTARKTL